MDEVRSTRFPHGRQFRCRSAWPRKSLPNAGTALATAQPRALSPPSHDHASPALPPTVVRDDGLPSPARL
jgi:hypothetical protein